MNILKTTCLSVVCLSASLNAQNTPTIVDRPPLSTSVNYPGYKAPLHGGYLLKLPVGQVQPKGWLREFLNRQRDGLNGQLGTVSAWLEKNNNQWLSDAGDHGWEEVPYWLRGYASLAYILDDEAMKKEAQVWFDGVLNHLKSDGFLGPKNTSNGRPEVWAQMIMLWALQTYHEHSGDERAIKAMTNYFKWELTVPDEQFLEDYWENKRGGDNEWSVIWLYNRTGDETLLPLIEKLHRNTSNWMMKDDLPNWHGVNVAQGFREPATYYVYTGDEAVLRCAYDNQRCIRERYGQVPGGMFGADENARVGYADPRQGAETCALVEQMASDEIMMGITGDPAWADHCEDVAFNTLPAALMPDMRALRYITSPNMAVSDGKNHAPSIDNSLRGMLSMSPFSSRCCQHNHGMGWPYFAEHLVMATTDNGLAAMLYAANETTAKVADGKTVRLVEETRYPFEEDIKITIHTDEPVTFPLYLRIPAWAQGATWSIKDQKNLALTEPGKYACINRQWAEGDYVTLHLPMRFTRQVWQKNKSSVSVNYGPLTLSLRIAEEYKQRDSRDHEIVQDDSHWQEGVNAALWPAYEIFAASDWNYTLKVDNENMPQGLTVIRKEWPQDNFPFTPENVPLEFTAVGQKVPTWGFDATGMTAPLPTSFEARDEQEQPLTLIPMGAARLRITAFPKSQEPLSDDCEE
ncbi:MAG: glycoside hydrolase family 127 protein [Bacteroidaceae bacterium]|nr:glycoside hydrolase family 127 protein [Bacteroidaceae bacterium]